MSFAIIIFLSQRYSTLGGSLKFCQGSGWFCMRFHFFIKASFIIDTKGWYCVTKGNISFSFLLFCFRRAGFLSVRFTSNSNFSFPENCVASLCPSRAFEIWNTYPYQTICILKLILKYLKCIFSIWTLFYCILILFDKEI